MFSIKSPEFENGSAIPARFTQEGDNISPALNWIGAPELTQEFALLCEDPDAPSDQPFVHWLIYGIDLSVNGLQDAMPTDAILKNPMRAKQGKNAKGRIGYLGPRPPAQDQAHHYHFKIFALDRKLNLKPELTKEKFLELAQSHIIETAELVGIYKSEGQSQTRALRVGEEAVP